jgi:alkylhydroperoxidase family enzyme
MTQANSSLDWLADAGLEPQVYEHLATLETQLWNDGTIEPPLMELIRLRAAQILDAPAELERRTPAAVAAGLDEAMVEQLSMWPTSPLFDERQRAVLSWSEQWIIDPEQITDDDAVRLRASLDDKECAALSTVLAVFESLTRTRVALGLAASSADQREGD